MRARLGISGEPKTFLLVKKLKLKDANMVSTTGEDPKKEREQEESRSTCKLHGARTGRTYSLR